MPANHNNDGQPNPNDPYKVGHGHPPKHTQFPKGKSGNPKGRPKKLKPASDFPPDDVRAILARVMAEKANVKHRGTQKEVSKPEVYFRTLEMISANGGTNATAKLIDMAIEASESQKKAIEHDRVWWEDYIKRQREYFAHCKKANLPADKFWILDEDIIFPERGFVYFRGPGAGRRSPTMKG